MDEARVESMEEERYVPRPAWQIWLARIGVGIMLVAVALYYWHIASGGLA